MATKCEHCGSSLARLKNERAFDFNKRRFCSRDCRYGAQRTKTSKRNCKYCNTVLVKREGERCCDFAKRHFCGLVCSYQRKLTMVFGVRLQNKELATLNNRSEKIIRMRLRDKRALFLNYTRGKARA